MKTTSKKLPILVLGLLALTIGCTGRSGSDSSDKTKSTTTEVDCKVDDCEDEGMTSDTKFAPIPSTTAGPTTTAGPATTIPRKDRDVSDHLQFGEETSPVQGVHITVAPPEDFQVDPGTLNGLDDTYHPKSFEITVINMTEDYFFTPEIEVMSGIPEEADRSVDGLYSSTPIDSDLYRDLGSEQCEQINSGEKCTFTLGYLITDPDNVELSVISLWDDAGWKDITYSLLK